MLTRLKLYEVTKVKIVISQRLPSAETWKCFITWQKVRVTWQKVQVMTFTNVKVTTFSNPLNYVSQPTTALSVVMFKATDLHFFSLYTLRYTVIIMLIIFCVVLFECPGS